MGVERFIFSGFGLLAIAERAVAQGVSDGGTEQAIDAAFASIASHDQVCRLLAYSRFAELVQQHTAQLRRAAPAARPAPASSAPTPKPKAAARTKKPLAA